MPVFRTDSCLSAGVLAQCCAFSLTGLAHLALSEQSAGVVMPVCDPVPGADIGSRPLRFRGWRAAFRRRGLSGCSSLRDALDGIGLSLLLAAYGYGPFW